MSNVLPAWTPHRLVEIHTSLVMNSKYDYRIGGREGKAMRALLERLLTPAMENAWSQVLKRISIPGDPDPPETIFSHVILALERSELKEESRAEKAARYQALAKTARDFAAALMGSELDHAPYHWFQDKVILGILGMMRPELASGTFCLLDPFPDTPKDTVFREISNKPGGAHVATSVGSDAACQFP